MVLSKEKLKALSASKLVLNENFLFNLIDRTVDNPNSILNSLSYSNNILSVKKDNGEPETISINRGSITKLDRTKVTSSITKDDSNEDYTKVDIINYNDKESGTFNIPKNDDPDKDIDKTKILSKMVYDNSDSIKNIYKLYDYANSSNIRTIETPKTGFSSKYDPSMVIADVNEVNKDDSMELHYLFESYDKSKSYTVDLPKSVINSMRYKTAAPILFTYLNLAYKQTAMAPMSTSKNDPIESKNLLYHYNQGYYAGIPKSIFSVKKTSSSSYVMNKSLGTSGINSNIIEYNNNSTLRLFSKSDTNMSTTLAKIIINSKTQDTYSDVFYNNFNMLFVLKNDIKLNAGKNSFILYSSGINSNSPENILKFDYSTGDYYSNPAFKKQASVNQFIGYNSVFMFNTLTMLTKSISIKAVLYKNSSSNTVYIDIYANSLLNNSVYEGDNKTDLTISKDIEFFNIPFSRYATTTGV